MSLVGGLLFNASAPAGAAFPGDNGLIAFERSTLFDTEIYTVAPDGSNLTKLTNNGFEDVDPAWSADGEQIAFANDSLGDFDIYTMDANGTNVTNLTPGEPSQQYNPTWSPDGSEIAFTNDATGTISTVPSGGGAITDLISGVGGSDHSPSYSPDGTQIAFVNGGSVYTMDSDGTNASAALFSGQHPDWSSSTDELAYEDGGDIEVVASDGLGAVLNLTTFGTDDNPVWSPDGEQILFDRVYALGFTSQIEFMASDGTGAPASTVVMPGGLLEFNNDPSWQPTDFPAPPGPPAPGFQRLSVVRTGNGTGTVTSTPAGVNCGSDCLEDYAHGTVVTLTASPTSDSTLASWNVAGCSGLTCQVTLTHDTTVNPVFSLKPPSPTVASAALDARCGQPLVICGTNGHDVLTGGPLGELILPFAGDDNVSGGGGGDVILDPSGNNIIRGGAGNDDLTGGPGRDHMRGGGGNDGLHAGAGNDRLTGGAGNDVCDDGPGSDVLKGCEN